jgi:dihydrofolate reductase
MGTIVDITTSLDGFVAGPNPTLEDPLGEGGERLHEWAVALEAWRERHGMEGGEASADSERLRESVDATGAVVMGRRMFSGGEGPWDADPNADGWWGDDPPFRAPVFIVTSHPRGTVAKEGGTSYTFVTDGVESAGRQAREATSFSRPSRPASWTSSGCTSRRSCWEAARGCSTISATSSSSAPRWSTHPE